MSLTYYSLSFHRSSPIKNTRPDLENMLILVDGYCRHEVLDI